MRISLLVVAALCATPAFAARPTPEEQLQALIAGRTAGPPQSCISQVRPTRTTTIDGIGVVYDFGGTRYVSRFDHGCPELDWRSILVTRTPTTQLCAGDIANVVTNPPPSILIGSCVFGPFTPYKRAK